MPKEKVNSQQPRQSSLNNNYDIAYDFASKTYQKFREIIKSIVLFGSVSKQQEVRGSDIDIIIIVDDASVAWDQELISWYREELNKLVSSQNYNREIHINTVTLSAFWEEVKSGTPVIMNIIRYGQPLIDFGGFFEPLKVLLAKGRIKPSPEAIFTTLRRAPEHIERAKFNILSSMENIYWAMVDSAHSALMAANQVPPSPEHISEMLQEVFVSQGSLDKKFVDYFNDIYTITKDITHGNVTSIKTQDVDAYIARAAEFEQVMRLIASKLIENEKIVMMQRNNYRIPQVGLIKPQQSENNSNDLNFPAFSPELEQYQLQLKELTEKNKQISTQLMQYKNELENLQKEKKILRSMALPKDTQLMQYKRRVDQLEHQNSSLMTEVPELKKRLLDVQQKNKDLLTEINNFKLNASKDIDFPTFNPEIEKLRSTNADLSIKVNELKKQLQESESKITSMSKELEKPKELEFPKFNPEIEKLRNSNKQLVEQITNYKSQLKESESKIKELSKPNERKIKISVLREQIEDLKEKNKSLNEKFPDLRKQIEDLKLKNENLAKDVQKPKDMEFPEFNPELDKLKSSNKDLLTKVDEFKLKLEELSLKNKNLVQELTDIRSKPKELDFPAFNPELENLKKANKELSTKLATSYSQLKMLQNKLAEATKVKVPKGKQLKITTLRTQIEKLQSQNEILNSRIPDLRKQIEDLKLKNDNLAKESQKPKDIEFPTFNPELDKLKSSNKELLTKLEELKSINLKLTNELTDVKKQPAKTVTVTKDPPETIKLRESEQKLLAEVAKYKKQIEDLTKSQADKSKELEFPAFNPELENLKKSNKDLTSQISDYKKKISDMQSNLENIKSSQSKQISLSKNKDQKTKQVLDEVIKYKKLSKNYESKIKQLESTVKELKSKKPIVKVVEKTKIVKVKTPAPKPKKIVVKKQPKKVIIKNTSKTKQDKLDFPDLKSSNNKDLEFPEFKK